MQSWLGKNHASARWRWPQYRGRKINQHAREAMEPWHCGKCAFCEAPLYVGGEIEHFRSKTRYPLAAFVWRNLFLICPGCNQAKGAEEHTGCLKPDREDPADYLWVNPISLKMEPRPGVSEAGRQHARRTIERYGLDRPELTKAYQRYLEIAAQNAPLSLIDLVLRIPQPVYMYPTKLQWLAQSEQPFSLMVKSLLKYHGAML